MGRQLTLALCAATIGLLAAGAVIAAPPPDTAQVIKQRQDVMKRQLNATKALKAYLEGKASLADAQAAAADLRITARLIPSLFPPNTGMEQIPKSHAKPIIWQDWNKFLENQHILVIKTDALVAAAQSGDHNRIAATFVDMGKNACGACHSTFRAPLEKN
jgi:cytochrome c556